MHGNRLGVEEARRSWQTHGVGCANADDADDACPVVLEFFQCMGKQTRG